MKYITTSTFALLLTTFVIGCSQPSNTALFERGDYAMWQGRWSDAANDFKTATLQHPGDWEAQFKLGKCKMELGEPQLASQSLAIATALQPDNTEIADLYAKSLFDCGEQDKLFTYLSTRASEQQTVRAWTRFAEYAMDLDDPDTATIALNTAIKIGDGSNADPYILFATLSQRLGNNEEAVYYWQQAWIIEPHNEDIANALRSHGEVPGPTMTGIVDEVE